MTFGTVDTGRTTTAVRSDRGAALLGLGPHLARPATAPTPARRHRRRPDARRRSQYPARRWQTKTAGGIAWAIAEIPSMMLLIALGVQWARSDEREARRSDRQAARDGGAELAACNERCAA